MTAHRLGMTRCLTVLAFGERGLRDQRADPGIVGDPGKALKLFIGDHEFLAEITQLRAQFTQATLEQVPIHPASVRPRTLRAPFEFGTLTPVTDR